MMNLSNILVTDSKIYNLIVFLFKKLLEDQLTMTVQIILIGWKDSFLVMIFNRAIINVINLAFMF